MELSAALLTVVAVLLVTLPSCRSLYYQVRPTITVRPRSGSSISDVGEYDPDYSNSRKDINDRDLYVIDDPNVGCPGYPLSDLNITLPSSGIFVVMLPYVGSGVPCSEFIKAKTARNEWGADGIIFRYDPGSPSEGRLRDRPTHSQMLSGITIVTMELALRPSLLNPKENGRPLVSIVAHYHQFQTSQTFYFIVFAFCILMLLSCLWFVMSYIKRCHYNVQRRRRRVSPRVSLRNLVAFFSSNNRSGPLMRPEGLSAGCLSKVSKPPK